MVSNNDRARAIVLKLLKLPHARIIADAPPRAKVLDIGCGNGSPTRAKALRQDIHYAGVDIQEYNFSAKDRANCDSFTILDPADFNRQLVAAFEPAAFQLILMKHVIEHADDYPGLLSAAFQLLQPGGRLYLSFPSYESIGFVRADAGTLNFWDDPTHHRPPCLNDVVDSLLALGMTPERVILRHRHPILRWPATAVYALQKIRRSLGLPFKASALLWHAVGFEDVMIFSRKEIERQ